MMRVMYHVDSSMRTDTFWVPQHKLNLHPGEPVMKLTFDAGQIFSGDVSGSFVPTPSFKFTPAKAS
ncbi:hypothetical protein [Paraburkholderia dipogonis]|uniref:hypothetical protein n=1 Tax=Paraburkholderia dipogonis TaxID=1211383 RepID=UPI0038BB8B36